jgi:hypothetical protein
LLDVLTICQTILKKLFLIKFMNVIYLLSKWMSPHASEMKLNYYFLELIRLKKL